MYTSAARTVRNIIGGVAAALALALVAGFAAPTGLAPAARPGATFESDLTVAAAGTKVSTEEPAPFSTAVAAQKKTSTPIVVQTSSRSRSAARTTSTGTSAKSTASGSELSQAKAILAGYIAKHPVLAGTTITFGDAKGYQAICYYRSGRIVISPSHTASLSRIIGHEIWHVIDWRDNGTIDWGENVPPR